MNKILLIIKDFLIIILKIINIKFFFILYSYISKEGEIELAIKQFVETEDAEICKNFL